MKTKETIRTRIWREVAEPDNPFAAAACYCHGYDVYGDVLGKASWIEYLYLLFKGDRPDRRQVLLLEDLAVAIANPGPRDHSIRAAMDGGVGGSNGAACLMAALGVGAGQFGGAREVALAMQLWLDCGTDLQAWKHRLAEPPTEERADVWPPMEHSPGFDPYGASCPTPVRQVLHHLAAVADDPLAALTWLRDHREALEGVAGCPVAMTGVAAAAFHHLAFSPDQGEMLYLMLRLPGAAVHALEQKEFGFKRYPFFKNAVHLADDPGPFQEKPATEGKP